MNKSSLPLVLCILDGWGESSVKNDNAIYQAQKPFWDQLILQYPHTLLQASEEYVGLPKGQMGNSEVGHMTIGSGRVIDQDLVRIDKAILADQLRHNKNLIQFLDKIHKNKGRVHIWGLLSDGGVHSHDNHMAHLIKLTTEHHLPTFVHAVLDGRDTPPQSAHSYIEEFDKNHIKNNSLASWATIMGRFFAMDRDQRWERTEKAYQAVVAGQALVFQDPIAFVQNSYAHSISDEFIEPGKFTNYDGVRPEDGLIIANFRADRVRQLLRSFVSLDFKEFPRSRVPFMHALGMTHYAKDLDSYVPSLFPRQDHQHCLGQIFSEAGFKQLRIAETEKYAHVTFFFDAGHELPFSGEERILIPSPKVKTYDLKPEMSAIEITKTVTQRMQKRLDDIIVINFANADMVGHTGNLKATTKAIEVIDSCLGRIASHVIKQDGTFIITADHGNAEAMIDESTHQPHTAHTCNLVPFVIVSPNTYTLKNLGTLADIAPTILDILNLPIPTEMTGKTLLVKA